VTTRIEIQVRKIRGPWLDVVIQRVQERYVVAVIPAHLSPRFGITPHAPEPEVLPGVWHFTPYPKEAACGVKLIGIQAELLPKDLKRVDSPVWRWRFKLMVEKAGSGFWEIEAIAIVRDGDITTAQELMKILDQEPVVRQVLFISRVFWERLDSDLTVALPTVGEA
jgi:hypothetical protein